MEKAPTLDQLREALRRAITEASTRAVARELIVSPAGLKKFLDNSDSTLYGKTLRKLIPWYEVAGILKEAFADRYGVEEAVAAARGEIVRAPPG